MQRIKKLQTILRQKKLSAALITNPINVRYLCGFIGTNGRLLVSQRKATLITDFRYFRSAKKQIPKEVEIYNQKDGLKKLVSRFATLGVEEGNISHRKFLTYNKEFKKVKLKYISGLVEEMRMIKDKKEIKIIKRAIQIANKSFKEFLRTISVRQSEAEMEWNLLCLVKHHGGEGFSFPPIICFGSDTADVHHLKSNKKLKRGDKILIDFGIKYKGYCTDMTRIIYTKKPTDDEASLYELVLKANQTGIKSVKVGLKVIDLDKKVRNVIEEVGYGDFFGHSTGHGIGLAVHELPSVSPAKKEHPNKIKIQKGMIFTIEPGVYADKFKGGIRIEDMVYVNEKGGVEVLTKEISKAIRIIKI